MNQNSKVNQVHGGGSITSYNVINNIAMDDGVRGQITNIERMVSEQQTRAASAPSAQWMGRGMVGTAATFAAGLSVGVIGASFMGSNSPGSSSSSPSHFRSPNPINPLLLPGGISWVLHKRISIAEGQPARLGGGSITAALVLPCGTFLAAGDTVGSLLHNLSSLLRTSVAPAQLVPFQLDLARRAHSVYSLDSEILLVDLLGPNAMFGGLAEPNFGGTCVVLYVLPSRSY